MLKPKSGRIAGSTVIASTAQLVAEHNLQTRVYISIF